MSPQKRSYEDIDVKLKRKTTTQLKGVIAGIGLLTVLMLLSTFSMPRSTLAAGNVRQVNQRATLPPEWTATFTVSPPAQTEVPLPTITLGGQLSTAVPLSLNASAIAGKQIIVDVDFITLHTGPSANEPAIEDAPRGTVKTLIAEIKNTSDQTTWWYVSDGYGWIPSTQNGVSTTRDYSPDALNQMLAKTDIQLQSDAQNPMLQFQKGWIHNNQQNYDAALSEISSAITTFKASPTVDPIKLAHLYDYLGKVYLDEEDYPNTAQNISAAIDLGLREAAVYDRRAIAYLHMGEYEQSRSDYEEAIRLNPKYGLLYSNMGSLLDAIDKQDPAQVDYFTKAIEIDPYFPYGYSNRANYYRQSGDLTDHVVDDFTTALRLAPNDQSALINRGVVHWLRQEFTLALRDFDFLIQLYPNYAAAYSDRGGLYAEMGNRKAALIDLRMAVKIGDKTGLAYYNFGVVLNEEGQYAAALYCYNKALEINPYRNDARINRANLLERFPDLDEKAIMASPNVEALITPTP
ncbi:MAG: tetratricopeptide repeat protein [Chloroflexota bacterium]